MSRRTSVTERVGGMLVCGSEGQRYKRRWTLRTASAKTVQVSIEERNLTEPGWERSRISRRSLGWVKEGGPRGGSGLEMVGCGTVRSGSTLDLGSSLVLEVVGSVNMAPGWGAGVVSGRRVIGRGRCGTVDAGSFGVGVEMLQALQYGKVGWYCLAVQ